MSTMQNDIKVGKLEVQMEEINRRFNALENTLEKKFEEVFKRFDGLDNKYVSKETFRFYQVVLGLIGTTVLVYILNTVLPNIFRGIHNL